MGMGGPCSTSAMPAWVVKCEVCGTSPCVMIWNPDDQEEGHHIRTFCGAHLREVVPLIAAGLELPAVQ